MPTGNSQGVVAGSELDSTHPGHFSCGYTSSDCPIPRQATCNETEAGTEKKQNKTENHCPFSAKISLPCALSQVKAQVLFKTYSCTHTTDTRVCKHTQHALTCKCTQLHAGEGLSSHKGEKHSKQDLLELQVNPFQTQRVTVIK